MKVVIYNPVDEQGGCIYRSISKALDMDYNIVKDELYKFAIYNGDTEDVPERYLLSKGFAIDDSLKGSVVKDLELKGSNIVYCFKDDWYHFVCVIDDTIYDKNEDALDLEVIKVYKKN